MADQEPQKRGRGRPKKGTIDAEKEAEKALVRQKKKESKERVEKGERLHHPRPIVFESATRATRSGLHTLQVAPKPIPDAYRHILTDWPAEWRDTANEMIDGVLVRLAQNVKVIDSDFGQFTFELPDWVNVSHNQLNRNLRATPSLLELRGIELFNNGLFEWNIQQFAVSTEKFLANASVYAASGENRDVSLMTMLSKNVGVLSTFIGKYF
jgi:hypothetical protein